MLRLALAHGMVVLPLLVHTGHFVLSVIGHVSQNMVLRTGLVLCCVSIITLPPYTAAAVFTDMKDLPSQLTLSGHTCCLCVVGVGPAAAPTAVPTGYRACKARARLAKAIPVCALTVSWVGSLLLLCCRKSFLSLTILSPLLTIVFEAHSHLGCDVLPPQGNDVPARAGAS